MSNPVSQMAESIRMAIDLEKSGRAFYLQAAERTVNPTGKAIFSRLAREETQHLLTFERMLDDEKGLSGWREWLKEYPDHPPLPVFDAKA